MTTSDDSSKNLDWKDRMLTWREMLTSKGAAQSF